MDIYTPKKKVLLLCIGVNVNGFIPEYIYFRLYDPPDN